MASGISYISFKWHSLLLIHYLLFIILILILILSTSAAVVSINFGDGAGDGELCAVIGWQQKATVTPKKNIQTSMLHGPTAGSRLATNFALAAQLVQEANGSLTLLNTVCYLKDIPSLMFAL